MLGRFCLSVCAAAHALSAATCVTLPAQIALYDGRPAPADATHLDTPRLQQALDSCGFGNTVNLVPHGPYSAFLSGPLLLRNGVTLTIAKDVVLFASRDARLFQVKQGSCGVVDDKGDGCRPLLSCRGAIHAAVSGAGVIDGQGDAPILGETYTWRALAQEARLNRGKVNAPQLLDRQTCPNLATGHVTLRNPAAPLF